MRATMSSFNTEPLSRSSSSDSSECDSGGNPDPIMHYLGIASWNNVKNQWYGTCKSAECKKTEAPWSDAHKNAVVFGAGRDVPQEILLIAVQHFVEQSRSMEEHRLAHLSALGQVCRAWMDICAPELYNHLSVKISHIDSLLEVLSHPGSRLKRYGRRLRIRGPVPWHALPQLLRSLPQVCAVTVVDREGQYTPHSFYNPRLSRSCSLLLTTKGSLLNMHDLTLCNQHFVSSMDLLRLLGTFPKLVKARVDLVTCQARPVAAPIASTRLRELIATEVNVLWPLAFCWAWPQRQSSSDCESYPGLRHADTLVLANVLRHIRLDGQCSVTFTLEKAWRPHSWIIRTSVKDTKRPDFADLMHIEFHISSAYTSQSPGRTVHNPTTSTGARTEHVVLRLRPELPAKLYLVEGRRNLSDIDEALSRLAHLRTLTLETCQRTSHNSHLEERFSVLPSTGRLHRRTCAESYELAMMVQEGREADSDRVAVSAMWNNPASCAQWLPNEPKSMRCA